uniref:ASPIC/UnbV domain-containing protein n=2 Tax=Compsopogon caeruleus TaxID=31354 RepID=A0A7S1TIU3_9RHOD|mmetsp:Transcript_9762/g.19888  ORF Transcript_9762/g.19888 Transcript_9762/m.19888 type:complete len:513 (+) Transcript_9762:195-1733(+)
MWNRSILLVTRTLLLFSMLWITVHSRSPKRPFHFRDVSKAARIGPVSTDKTSAPSIGDLNADGFLDIVMCNHVSYPVEVYYGSRSGVFRRVLAFNDKADRHGTAVGDINNDGRADIVLATETNPWLTQFPAELAVTRRNGKLQRMKSRASGLVGNIKSAAVRLLDVDRDGDLDLFILGRPKSTPGLHAIFKNKGDGTFERLWNTGIENAKAKVGFLVTDFDNDGFLDIFIFSPRVHLFRGLRNSRFVDVSRKVLPRIHKKHFSGAVAFDMDNDGDFDVYISGGFRLKGALVQGNDVLLENRGGKFVDVSRKAGIPRGGGRVGITAADFDNDGLVDVFLPSIGPGRQRIRDIILRNLGNGKFQKYWNHGAQGPLARDITYPSGAQAFDYNQDGLVDVIVGTRYRDLDIPGLFSGTLRLFKNVMKTKNHYLIVNVPFLLRGKTTMDALVIVATPNRKFYRRVGSVGESRTQSFVNQVHFGLGSNSKIRIVTIKLLDGTTVRKGPFSSNQMITIP